MLRQFFKDSFIYGFAGIISRSISIILVPIYTRLLSPADFGIIDLIATFAAFISVAVPLGISSGVARYFPDAATETDKISYASSSLWFTFSAYLVFTSIGLAFNNVLADLLLDSRQWNLLFQVSIFAIAANGMFYFFQNLLRWQLQPRLFVLSSIVTTLTTALLSVFIIIVLKKGVIGIFIGQIVGSSAGSAIAWYANRKLFKFKITWGKLKSMLAFSIPIVPALIGEFITNYIDRIAIRSMLSVTDLGLYGIGYRFASIVSLLMLGFNSSLTPLIYNNYQKESTPRELARIFRYFLALALPLLLFLTLFSTEILQIFTTPQYYSSWKVIPLLSMAFLLLTLYNFAPGIDLARKTKLIAVIHLTTATLNAALNYIFIPHLGISGSALSTLISAFFSFFCYMYFSQKYYPVPHQWKRILIAFFITTIIAILGIFLMSHFPASVALLVAKGIAFITGLFFSILILFNQDEIKSIPKLLPKNHFKISRGL